MITCPQRQYKEVLRLATSQINPANLGIEGMSARRAVTGAHIFEIGGPDKQQKADALAGKIREVLADREDVKVTRPTMTAELKIKDLHDAIEVEEVQRAIASSGNCDLGLVKIGPIQRTGRGLGTAWVRCPLASANKLATMGKIMLGWTKVSVEALEKRPLQCFKCLGKGHVWAQYGSITDRFGCCYKCGQEGHLARDCDRGVKCPVCVDLGRPAGHRAGSKACKAPRKKGKGGAQIPPPVQSCPCQHGG